MNTVIAAIANKAASEVAGVFSMAGGISDVFGKKMSKGIKVDAGEKNTKIDSGTKMILPIVAIIVIIVAIIIIKKKK